MKGNSKAKKRRRAAWRNNAINSINSRFRPIMAKIKSIWKFLPSWVGYVVLLVTIVSIALFLFLRSNFFIISNVKIADTVYVPAEEISSVTNKIIGERIVSIDTMEIESEVGNISLYIKDVYARKIFPDTIEVNIEERIPYIYLNVSSLNKTYLLDNESFILESLESSQNKQYPLIETVTTDNQLLNWPEEAGESIEYLPLDFVFSLKDYNKQEGDGTLSTNKYEINDESVKINILQGTEVTFDTNQDLYTQIQRLEQILQDTAQKGLELEYVDVSLSNPYGRYK